MRSIALALGLLLLPSLALAKTPSKWAMSPGLKQTLHDARKARPQYKDARMRRGLTTVAVAKTITKQLQQAGFRSPDVGAVRNFVQKGYVEHTDGARFHSNWLRIKPRSYAITFGAAQELNGFFTNNGMSIRAVPKKQMSNPAVNAWLQANRAVPAP